MHPKLRRQVVQDWLELSEPPIEPTRPANLPAVYQKVFSRLGLAERLRETTLRESWAEVVGPVLEAHCHPGIVRSGKLYVKVDHPAWLHDITMSHKKEILAAVQNRFPHLKIRELVLRIG